MLYFRRLWNLAGILCVFNAPLIFSMLQLSVWAAAMIGILLAVAFVLINIFPLPQRYPSRRLGVLRGGTDLLILFLIAVTLEIIWMVCVGILWMPEPIDWPLFWINAGITLLAASILFWNGMIRVYCTSMQLGIKRRIVGALLGWVPIANIIALFFICRVTSEEYRFETEKQRINEERKDRQICKTRYPLLLVHGVFFRDSRFLNYWGRVPKELVENGAEVYYGQQQSAASIADSGAELKERIQEIIEETGCEKLNIIAHSKGGLDSRYAISCLGIAPYVASLTTINTPHKGCIFVERLLGQVPAGACQALANTYNHALRKMGEQNPDFMAAVSDLTEQRCRALLQEAPDQPGIFYQSIGSKAACARSGKFPLNVSYHLVKRFDGENDGLVSVDAMQWGQRFTLVSVPGRRGVTHGDMIDLNREDIPGFDVREFYVQLVHDLQQRGL
ncbi:MAG TPA: triacylglycerol lipase [Firmicutes bacterium]|nr:triacylglycerol lipase [Bacillota bacterium]